jgi:hypothetical protein
MSLSASITMSISKTLSAMTGNTGYGLSDSFGI